MKKLSTSTAFVLKDSPALAKTLLETNYRKTTPEDWVKKDNELMKKNIGIANRGLNIAKGIVSTTGAITGGMLGGAIGGAIKRRTGNPWALAAGAAVGALTGGGGMLALTSTGDKRHNEKIEMYKLMVARRQDSALKSKKLDYYVKD